MELASLLEKHRDAILSGWFGLIAGTYPRLTSDFLAKQKDPFRNPVGHAIRESIGPLYDQVVSTMDSREILRALDRIIRIRAVQEFSCSEAVGFVFQLKSVLHGVLNGQLRGPDKWDAFADIEARIDRVALLAFEKYTQCREQLHEIRHKEIKIRALRQLKRSNAQPAVSECSACSQYEEGPIDDDV